MKSTSIRLLALFVPILLMAACATTAPPPEERDPRDPWEPFNRSVYQFNSKIDQLLLLPAARGYREVTPGPLRQGVRNFFTNLRSTVVMFSLALQGRAGDSGEELGRFLLNTTLGIGGFFDVATAADLPKHNEDFGQTMATWGWENSRFVMLPLLGPSTVRDGFGRVVDIVPTLAWRRALEDYTYVVLGLDILQTRAALIPLERDLEQAYDPYILMRDGWLQRRDYKVHDGQQDLPDYDAYLEDDYDDPAP